MAGDSHTILAGDVTIPCCLRHGYESEALEDAKALAIFLGDMAASFMLRQDMPADGNTYARGVQLCFDLLNDKLAICSGERAWPLATCGHNAPSLGEALALMESGKEP